MATHFRTCPLCEAMCGLEIEVEGDRVTRVRGDRADVWSKGFLCPKGASIGQLHHDPDRIREPMVRDPETGEWREVGWDEAFARCEELLAPVIAEHGIEAVTAYLGNPNVHSYSLSRFSGAVPGLAGMKVLWSAGTVDQWPKNLVCAQLFGGMWKIPIPDVANTDLFVVMGANPHASNGSLLAHPDLIGELDRIRERGGRTIVIDPRRTGTAERADEWLPIVPGTDAALLLAVVAVLDEEDLVDLGSGDRPGARGGRGAGGGPGVRARGGGVVVRDRRWAHPPARPGPGRHPPGGGLRPHRPLHPGVRHAGHLAGVGGERADRSPRC